LVEGYGRFAIARESQYTAWLVKRLLDLEIRQRPGLVDMEFSRACHVREAILWLHVGHLFAERI